MRKLYFTCSIFFLLFSAIPVSAQDKIIAVVNKEVITSRDLKDFINFTRMQLSSRMEGENLEEKMKSLEPGLLEQLIEDRLILQESKKIGILIDEARVKARIDEVRREYPSEAYFQEALAAQGLVQSDLENKIREQLLMYTIVDIKVRSRISVKPAEVTEYYQKEIGKFRSAEQLNLESLALDTWGAAKRIEDGLRAGRKMGELAAENSLEVNNITVNRSEELRKEIQDAVSGLKPGEFSGPVAVGDRYYIFRVEAIIPSFQKSLPEVQDAITETLFDRKMQESMAKWLDELRKRSYIKVFSE